MSFRGKYLDGRTASSHRVEVNLMDGVVQFHDQTGDVTGSWRPEEYQLEGGNVAGEPLRIVHRDEGEIHVEQADQLLDNLSRVNGFRIREWFSDRPYLAQIGIWTGLTVLAVALMVIILPLVAEPVAKVVPEPVNQWMGEQTLQAVESRFSRCENPSVEQDLKQFLTDLRSRSSLNQSFEVHLVESSVPNALATPGGNLVVFDGLTDLLEEPRQLAGVLAHEAAHVQHHHPTAGVIRSMGYRFLVSAILGDMTVASQLGRTLLDLRYRRRDERIADRDGVLYLNEAGFDSRGMGAAFEQLRSDVGTSMPGFLSTHPTFEQRIKQVERLGEEGEQPFSDRQWEQFRELCEGTSG